MNQTKNWRVDLNAEMVARRMVGLAPSVITHERFSTMPHLVRDISALPDHLALVDGVGEWTVHLYDQNPAV